MVLALCAWLVVTTAALIGLAVVAPHALLPAVRTTALILCAAASVALLFHT